MRKKRSDGGYYDVKGVITVPVETPPPFRLPVVACDPDNPLGFNLVELIRLRDHYQSLRTHYFKLFNLETDAVKRERYQERCEHYAIKCFGVERAIEKKK
jgi:hypothetical protein